MGLRFRKSIKIAPGLKLNINKKSIGLTAGVKGAHYTVNSKGKKTATVGIPGTGLHYTESTSGGSNGAPANENQKKSDNNYNYQSSSNGDPNNDSKKWYQKTSWIIALLILFFPVGIYLMWRYTNWKKPIKIFISLFFGIILLSNLVTSSPEIDTIKISPSTIKEMDINETELVDILVAPSECNTDKLEFHSSNQSIISFEKSKTSEIEGEITTHSTSGSAEIWILASNGVESNHIKIEVIDKVALKKAQEEAVAKKKAEEEAAAKKKAEEEAKKAEEERIAAEAQAAAETANQQQSAMVWIPRTGSKYHSDVV